MASVRTANLKDLLFILKYDEHIDHAGYISIIQDQRLLIIEEDKPIGFLRYNFFWDDIPFMNLLYIKASHRDQGYGRALVEYWETMLIEKGYHRFMTSTMAIETAKNFYEKLGYRAIGHMFIDNENELIYLKE